MADFENVQPDVYKRLGRNYTSGRPYGIKGTTIHHMAGDLDADGCNAVWTRSGASAHYSVDRDGVIAQHVDDGDRAWACGDGIGTGGGNDVTISIEHANDSTGPWTVHPQAVEQGAHLVAALHVYYGLGRPEWGVNVFPHSHWKATACPGELAGSQNAQYMERARYWYDVMSGAGKPAVADIPVEERGVHRLLNPGTGEHLFTPNRNEAVYLNGQGWSYEGVGWHHGDGEPVYRLYNPNGEHVLTASHAEHDELLKSGWLCEGESFGQGDGAPVERLYNPNGGVHHYTIDTNEVASLVATGWRDEGVAFLSAD